jgi:hypothetical protein
MSRRASRNDVAIPARACHGICIYPSQLGESSMGWLARKKLGL